MLGINVVNEVFDGDFTGIACVGYSLAMKDEDKFNELRSYLEEKGIAYDCDEDSYEGVYLVVLGR